MVSLLFLIPGAAHRDDSDSRVTSGDEGRPELPADQAENLASWFSGALCGCFQAGGVSPESLSLNEVDAVLRPVGF